ncbi:MAG: hypothetical protein U0T73_00365 [Chitinophagales bacterium]
MDFILADAALSAASPQAAGGLKAITMSSFQANYEFQNYELRKGKTVFKTNSCPIS